MNPKIVFFACTILFCTLISNAQIRINEIVTSNSSGLTDFEEDYPDWIELYNDGDQDINLLNWSITDDSDEPQQWHFPSVIIPGKSYLIVFASGKDLKDVELHTNFKLGQDGEYLSLTDNDGVTVTEFNPSFPAIPTDYSLGFIDGAYIASSIPTPGAANILSDDAILPVPQFSNDLGFYDQPFSLSLTTPLEGGEIRFTLDGSTPTATSALYSQSIEITTTTVVRAITMKSGDSSPSLTKTFLFLDEVINQSNTPAGYPSMWGPYAAIPGTAIADYEMDPEITQDPDYKDKMVSALKAIPTISLVTDRDNLFLDLIDDELGGIYMYTGAPGLETGNGWERPASLELISPDGTREVQVNCGVELHGQHSRRAEKTPKHSFRISFKSKYGPGRLNYPFFGEDGASDFNSIILRAGFGNSFVHHRHSQREKGQLIRDKWIKDTQALMGHSAGRGFLAHLYVNGLYWGVYNPTERINEDFMESYFGGATEDYDIVRDYSEVTSGTSDAWNAMMDLVNGDITSKEIYHKVLGENPDGSDNPNFPQYIDPVNLADYMLLNFFVGNQDWDHKNWISGRDRMNDDQGFYFFCWDSEFIINSRGTNVTGENNAGSPSGIFQQLMKNDEFKELFDQRVQLHCTNGGLLTPTSTVARWEEMTQKVELAIITESARWGDYRRDVHNHSFGPYEFYTPLTFENHRNYLLNEYFPDRTDILLQQIKDAGFTPVFRAPFIHINGAEPSTLIFQVGDELTLNNSMGTIYYTLDGSDPKVVGTTSASTKEYTTGWDITESGHILSRAKKDEEWSSLMETKYYISQDRSDLKLTEVHYHPMDEGDISGDDFEFIEFKNTGDVSIDLGGVKLLGGIRFVFPFGFQLAPNEFLVLASDLNAFKSRYGFEADFEYSGNLGNNSDEFTLADIEQNELIFLQYTDNAPWPPQADGDGYSLVPININPTGDQSDVKNWARSSAINGTPKGNDEIVLTTDLIQDFRIYPNPARNILNIRLSPKQSPYSKIEVLNLSGQVMISFGNTEVMEQSDLIKLDIRSISPGLYFLRLLSEEGIQMEKLIIK